MTNKKLRRSKRNQVIAGVCSGLAKFLDIDVVIIRLLWVIITIFTGFFPGILTYIIWVIIVPEE